MKTCPRALALTDMLRSRPGVQLLATFTILGFVSTEHSVFNDGWIPVSQDTIYNQVRRQSVHTSNHPQRISSEDNFKLSKNRPLIHQLSKNIEDQEDVNNEDEFDNQNNVRPNIFLSDSESVDKHLFKSGVPTRKAKKIGQYIINQEINNLIEAAEDKDTLQRLQTKEVNTENRKQENMNEINLITEGDSTTFYEVTEDPTEETDVRENISYQYNPPANQTLTSQFFDILSNYNIKANDALTNYEISRQNKGQIPTKLNYRFPTLIPYGHNSPNHMPVDPLFAVFLSNYGIYLPGMYGIGGNYNNLYGYLASNNIHNNKPFGLYKIYSDTDSSN